MLFKKLREILVLLTKISDSIFSQGLTYFTMTDLSPRIDARTQELFTQQYFISTTWKNKSHSLLLSALQTSNFELDKSADFPPFSLNPSL